MEALFNAVRRACPAAVWSKGVELARRDVALGKSFSSHEIEMHLVLPGAVSALTVVLYPEDAEWSCDCDSPHDACAHVACAVIALKNAQQENRDLFSRTTQTGHVVYRFSKHPPSSLTLARTFVSQGVEKPLQAPLATLTHNPTFRITPTPQDLQADAWLTQHKTQGPLSVPVLHGLLDILRGHPHVFWLHTPIQVGEPVAALKAVVEDAHHGHMRVSLHPNIAPQETFHGRVVLVQHTLARVSDPGLSAEELQRYKQGVLFAPQDLAFMTASVLPQLRSHMPVDIRTQHLPTLDPQAQPHIQWHVSKEGHSLQAMPVLVYGNPPIARVDGDTLRYLSNTLPVRNIAEEKKLLAQLQESTGFTAGLKKTYTGSDAVHMARTLKAHTHEHAVLNAFELHGTLQPVWDLQPSSYDIRFNAGTRTAHTEDVLKAYAQKESVVPLMEGGFAQLPAQWLHTYGAQLQALLQARNEQRLLQPHHRPALVQLLQDTDTPIPAFLEPYEKMVEGFSQLPQETLPSDLQASLRHYQQEGVRWLQHMQKHQLGALLADDMGLGKTLQTLCTFGTRTLVVAPTSVLHNWKKEINRFRPSLKVHVYHGPQRRMDMNADVILTTYALLRMDQEMLCSHTWDTVVLDEAHTIKNSSSQVARAAYGLKSLWRVAVTGTPIENSLQELWSHMHFLNPGLLGSEKEFETMCNQQHDTVLRRVKPFFIRRKKTDVAPELPPRTHMVLSCTLTQEERNVYNAVQSATLSQALNALNENNNVMQALEALLRLRQAACHSALVPGQHAGSSSKTQLLLETLQEIIAEGHKSLVFSQWTSFLDLIEPHFKRHGMSYARLDGSTHNREEVVNQFQSAHGPSVLLISLKAGGTGLNLTAADHVFLMDPWWNPAVEDQASDRAHRIGQTKPVMVSQLIAEDTVEERILLLQEHKRQLAASVFEEGSSGLTLTQDDLRTLLHSF